MKKQLLLIPALLVAALATSQSNAVKPTGIVNVPQKLAYKFRLQESSQAAVKPNNLPVTAEETPASPEDLKTVNTTAVTWAVIGGSRNIYGVLESHCKPLQWNDQLNAVSFIHRASDSYVGQPSSPGTESGAMVADYSTNWGATWDSTCFFSDVSWRARYPQGAIYNPPGNNTVNNAYIVGSGAVTDGSDWKGSWLASKQLGGANNNYTASSTPNAMQLLYNTPPYPVYGKSDFASYGFGVTDDGIARSMAIVCNDINGGTNAAFGIRGAMCLKGTFNAGVFSWSGDSMCPATILRSDGTKQMWSEPIMAWNESGTIGYVIQIGAAATATGSNKGWQPLVFKTTNSGASWSQVNGIDFNSPAFAPVLGPLLGVSTNPNLKIPFFKIDEGFDAVVDNSGKLHIVATLVGSASSHNDSLEYTNSFTAENYSWPHVPGMRPYIYDFIGDGATAWTYRLIDSMSTEGPGAGGTDPGFNDNPWDVDQGSKVRSDARIQASRTPDGATVLFTWAESDTNFTNLGKKWNSLPNIKARAMNANTYSVSPTEVNVSKPQTGSNPQVANRAMFHFTSPTFSQSCTGSTLTIKVPVTVSNSNPYSQLTNNKHWYSTAGIDFLGIGCPVGISEHLGWNVSQLDVYPNPANDRATVAVDVKERGTAVIAVYNLIGQQMQRISTQVENGANKIEMDLSALSAGIYMVKVTVGNASSTKKLIVE